MLPKSARPSNCSFIASIPRALRARHRAFGQVRAQR